MMTEKEKKDLFQVGVKLDRAGNFVESIKIHKALAEEGYILRSVSI